MNIEKRLDINARNASEVVSDIYENPADFKDIDIKEFNDALQAKSIASWAVVKQIENSHGSAKKIIDSI